MFKQDGDKWRRVVPSPEPKRIFELRPIKWLLEHNTIVIAAGGGGIPTMYEPGADRKLVGVECVIDKDLASELLARELERRSVRDADRRRGRVRRLGQADAESDPARLAGRAWRRMSFAAGSMGPKVDAACRFADGDRQDGRRSARWRTSSKIIAGEAGTTISNRRGRHRLRAPVQPRTSRQA